MSVDIAHSRAWWAASSRSARGAAIGASILAIALTVTVVLVWTSPQSPIAAIDQVTSTVTKLAQAQDRAQSLQQRVADLQKQIDGKNAKLVAQSGALGHANSELSKALAQVQTLQAASDAAKSAGHNAAAATRVTPSKANVPAPVAPVTAPSKAELLHPDSPYFGMYTQQAPFNWATYDATTAEIGAQTNMVGYFEGWDQPFRADAVTRSWQHGQLPFLTWESRPILDGNDVIVSPNYSLPRILAGDFDAYLHQFAHDVAATGLPVAIRLDQEMNGVWYPWAETDGAGASINGNAPGQFVQMWRHVHDIFQQEGANDDVLWVWSPNRVDNLPASHQSAAYTASLYPGDDYVDWVGMSAYLRPPYVDGQSFTFDATFGRTLAQFRALTTKPILLSEVGASETDGHKPAWTTSFFQGLNDPANADVIGFSWFDEAVTSYVEGVRQTNDWRIDSRPDTLAAFVAGLTAPGGRFRLEPAS